MIYGIGVDVLQLVRIKRTLARFGQRFIDRLLLPGERAQLARTARPERFIAMRFAAKEAVVKAMGTGFAHGMWIRDVGVVQDRRGKPEIVYSARGERMRRKLGIGAGHVTLTDEAGLIVAVAVLERAPRRKSPRAAAPKSPRPAARKPARRTATRARAAAGRR